MTINVTAPIANAAATVGCPSLPDRPAMPPTRPSIEKVRTPATLVPGFCPLSFQPRSTPISNPLASAVSNDSA
jgi:hypothetical protein